MVIGKGLRMKRARLRNRGIKKQAFWDVSPKAFFFMLMMMAMLSVYFSITSVNDKYTQEFEREEVMVKNFFNGIFYADGYVNSTVQPWCSDAQTFTDITVHRVISCIGLRNVNYEPAGGGLESDPTQSYLKVLDRFKDGCHFYLSEFAGATNQMYLYAECDLGLSKISPEVVESDWDYFFKESYPLEYLSIEREAVDISTGTGGSWNDGKFRIIFRK